MRPFNASPTCDKCGHKDFTWKYESATQVFATKPSVTREWLRLTCKRCDYQLTMSVLYAGDDDGE